MQGLDYKYFSFLFKTTFNRLVLYGKKYVESEEEAKDIVQDCFVKLWKIRDEVDCLRAKTLVFMMVRNSCLNALKHRAVVLNFERNILMGGEDSRNYPFELDFCSSPEDMEIFSELNRLIEDEVGKLPERCREVFVMSRFRGLRNSEIAQLLGISEPAVHKHLDKALEKLRKKLDYKG